MKHRISIDLEKELYLSLAIKALHTNTKIKNYIENNLEQWVKAPAPKEVSAAADQRVNKVKKQKI
jgi:hypothetical protein